MHQVHQTYMFQASGPPHPGPVPPVGVGWGLVQIVGAISFNLPYELIKMVEYELGNLNFRFCRDLQPCRVQAASRRGFFFRENDVPGFFEHVLC